MQLSARHDAWIGLGRECEPQNELARDKGFEPSILDYNYQLFG